MAAIAYFPDSLGRMDPAKKYSSNPSIRWKASRAYLWSAWNKFIRKNL